MIVLPDSCIKNIYKIVGNFTYSGTDNALYFNIENLKKEDLKSFFEFAYCNFHSYVNIETNFDNTFDITHRDIVLSKSRSNGIS